MASSRSFIFYLPSIIWAVVIYALSSNAPLEENPFDWMDFIGIDKLGHLIFYFILCIMIMWGMNKIRGKSSPWIAILISFLYGFVMEVLQYYFYEGREFDFIDMLANGVGAILGTYIFSRFFAKR